MSKYLYLLIAVLTAILLITLNGKAPKLRDCYETEDYTPPYCHNLKLINRDRWKRKTHEMRKTEIIGGNKPN